MERRDISSPIIHPTKAEEGGRLGSDQPSSKMHGVVHQPHERTRHGEWDGDGGLDGEVGTTGTNKENSIGQEDPNQAGLSTSL